MSSIENFLPEELDAKSLPELDILARSGIKSRHLHQTGGT